MAQSAPVKVTNAELATVREAMRELPRLLADLDAGTIDKLVLTQRNQMRAVLVSVERYSALEQAGTLLPTAPEVAGAGAAAQKATGPE
ncbi:MAG: hypothetical protein WBP81_29695 [Solirubrobacteraceae bacterium]